MVRHSREHNKNFTRKSNQNTTQIKQIVCSLCQQFISYIIEAVVLINEDSDVNKAQWSVFCQQLLDFPEGINS